MKKYLNLLLRLISGISTLICSVFLILMIYDSLVKRSENFKLFELVNPFSGKYLVPFLSTLFVSVFTSVIRSLYFRNENE